jgi:chromosome segregation ATPase
LCKQCNVGSNQKIWHCCDNCRDNSNAPQGPYQGKRKQQKKRTKSVAQLENDELQRKATAYDQIIATYRKVEEMRPQLRQMQIKLEEARRQMHEFQTTWKRQSDEVKLVRAQYTSSEEELQSIINRMYQVRTVQLDPSTCTTESVVMYMELVTRRTEIEEDRHFLNMDLSEKTRHEHEMLKNKEAQERIVSEITIDMVAMDSQLEQLKDRMKQLLLN